MSKDTKYCKYCDETKSVEDFSLYAPGKYVSKCKPCYALASKKWRRKNPGRTPTGVCEVEDCVRKIKARKLCELHYTRMLKWNSTDKPLRVQPEGDYKTCNICKEEKSINDFYWYKNKERHMTWCKVCNGEKQLDYRLRSKYGIDLDNYNEMLDKQNSSCAICEKHFKENSVNPKIDRPIKLAVDHNHETGKVRGLLCNNCNRFLGLAEDSISVLENAIKYLVANS